MIFAQAPDLTRISVALLLLRIACAAAFLYHGSGILFGAFSGPGPAGLAASHHWPLAVGYLVGLAQVAGALAVLTGLFVPLGCAALFLALPGRPVSGPLPPCPYLPPLRP